MKGDRGERLQTDAASTDEIGGDRLGVGTVECPRVPLPVDDSSVPRPRSGQSPGRDVVGVLGGISEERRWPSPRGRERPGSHPRRRLTTSPPPARDGSATRGGTYCPSVPAASPGRPGADADLLVEASDAGSAPSSLTDRKTRRDEPRTNFHRRGRRRSGGERGEAKGPILPRSHSRGGWRKRTVNTRYSDSVFEIRNGRMDAWTVGGTIRPSAPSWIEPRTGRPHLHPPTERAEAGGLPSPVDEAQNLFTSETIEASANFRGEKDPVSR